MVGRTFVAVTVFFSCAPAVFAGLTANTQYNFTLDLVSGPDADVFNFMAIRWESGSQFSGSGFGSFSPGYVSDHWSAVGTPTLANAWFSSDDYPDTTTTNLVTFDTMFDGPLLLGTSFDFFAFDTDRPDFPVWALKASWNGIGWAFNNSSDELNMSLSDLTLSPVPAPGAALLGILGLGVVGWIKKRVA